MQRRTFIYSILLGAACLAIIVTVVGILRMRASASLPLGLGNAENVDTVHRVVKPSPGTKPYASFPRAKSLQPGEPTPIIPGGPLGGADVSALEATTTLTP